MAAIGLRELKKARTRRLIADTAARLFVRYAGAYPAPPLTGGNAFSIPSDSDGAVTTAPSAEGGGGVTGVAAVVGTITITTGVSNGMIGQWCTG